MKRKFNSWTKEKCQQEAFKYDTRTKFNKGCISAYNYARSNNFLDEICQHMIIVGNQIKRCIYCVEFNNN